MPLYDEYHGKTLNEYEFCHRRFKFHPFFKFLCKSHHLSYIQVTATKGSNAETAPQRRKVESIASIDLALV